MSSPIITSLALTSAQIAIYMGTCILIAGVLGGIFNTIVFLSLNIFRQSSCAHFLTVISIVNIGQLITGLLSRIMITGFNIDWPGKSVFYCKFRLYFFQVCSLTSMTCVCLATVDQYLATCTRPPWQKWINIKVAYRLTAIFVFIWLFYNIPHLIYYNQVVSPDSGEINCIITNSVFQVYQKYGNILITLRILPLCITSIFGILAYRNVQQIAHRTLPLVRRELDKQLTAMVLVQIVVMFFTIVPYLIVFFLMNATNLIQYPIVAAQLQLAETVTQCLYFVNFAVSIRSFISV
jgi:hypothetical protein